VKEAGLTLLDFDPSFKTEPPDFDTLA